MSRRSCGPTAPHALCEQAAQKLEQLYARSQIPDVSRKVRWTLATAPTPTQGAPSFSHKEWDAVLRAHLKPGGAVNDIRDCTTVDYDGVAKDAKFAAYLKALAAADVDNLPVLERFALWMNAYNALCISLIIEQEKSRGAPISSINDITTSKVRTARAAPQQAGAGGCALESGRIRGGCNGTDMMDVTDVMREEWEGAVAVAAAAAARGACQVAGGRCGRARSAVEMAHSLSASRVRRR